VEPDRKPSPTAAVNDGIPVRMWSDVADLTRLLDETRRVLQATQGQAESLRRRADRDGHAAGVAKAQAEAVRHVLEAHQAARELVGASESRIISLAASVVTRIAPTLNTPDVVAELAAEALRTVQGERHVRIHVGSGAVEATREMLQRWRDAHPEAGAAQVLTEPQLAPFCCVVESELGRVEVNQHARLEAPHEMPAGIATQSHPIPTAAIDSGPTSSPETFFWLLRDGDS
jgi:flagellar biosynthesis/type III secretory pathway protein FliH